MAHKEREEGGGKGGRRALINKYFFSVCLFVFKMHGHTDTTDTRTQPRSAASRIASGRAERGRTTVRNKNARFGGGEGLRLVFFSFPLLKLQCPSYIPRAVPTAEDKSDLSS